MMILRGDNISRWNKDIRQECKLKLAHFGVFFLPHKWSRISAATDISVAINSASSFITSVIVFIQFIHFNIEEFTV